MKKKLKYLKDYFGGFYNLKNIFSYLLKLDVGYLRSSISPKISQKLTFAVGKAEAR